MPARYEVRGAGDDGVVSRHRTLAAAGRVWRDEVPRCAKNCAQPAHVWDRQLERDVTSDALSAARELRLVAPRA